MRALGFAVAVIALALPLAAGAQNTPELVPAYTRTVLPNGLVLLLLEQHEVPVVDFQFTLRSGSIADPAGKEGLADVTISLLRKGTDRYTSEQIAEELDFLGGQLDLDASYERCSVSAEFLSKDADRGIELLADVLLHPKFDAAELKKLVDLDLDALRDLKDTPRVVVGNYYDSFLFPGHPFGRPVSGTETSLPAITRDDVQTFYQRVFQPNGTILAVSGDFSADAMKTKIESAFGAWPKGDFQAASAPEPKPVKGRKVLLVDKPDATQTYFRIGNIGVAKGNPDDAPLDVVNTVFGGRFTSWLMTELRTKSGLSYNAHSNFVERRVPGSFYISSFTRVDDTGKAMDMAFDILDRLHTKGLSDAELASAKNYIRGQFPPEYETPGQLAQAMAELEFFGLDRSFINQHTQHTDAVNGADAKRVIAKRYPSKDVVVVMVGPAAKIRKVASKYGSVTEKSVTAPGF
jgi:predicted Zn-dependent peptidase